MARLAGGGLGLSTRGRCTGGSRTSPTPRRSPDSPGRMARVRPICLHRYRHHVQRVPMIALRLDGCRLRKGLSRMKPSALGLDGWSLANLRSLPNRLLGWLADLLREVERLGKWPARLAEGYTALITKEGPPMLRDGNPDVKVPGQRHHCRHRWRILVGGEGGGVVYLSLSTHHREGGVGLPYIWVQGTPAVVWRVAGFFRP